jgi:hypothetical protein
MLHRWAVSPNLLELTSKAQSPKLKWGKLKAEIAGFELWVFLNFSFQLLSFLL